MASVNYKPLPPTKYLLECFKYNPDTGIIKWKSRPLNHFNTVIGWRSFNSQCPGKVLNRADRDGYLSVNMQVDGRRESYLLHRLAWAMHHGSMPVDRQIDHINWIESDNRIENLRLATPAENTKNTRARSGTSSKKGVYFDKSKSKWKAQYQLNGKRKHIGYFKREQDAVEAFNYIAVPAYGEFAPRQ